MFHSLLNTNGLLSNWGLKGWSLEHQNYHQFILMGDQWGVPYQQLAFYQI
jgi:hypothetical protein